MTREQVEQCKEFEQDFRWAINTNFIHMDNTRFSKVAKLYKDILGVAMTKNQMTCNTCRLNAMKALGNDYFASRDAFAKEDREKEKEEAEAPKKKAGRPRKIDID